ncbi:MAG: 2-amino-4-hydroxy-6-hydroxymethyldihydropteridine diphosphokinase [Burkholderiaceae bacterium]
MVTPEKTAFVGLGANLGDARQAVCQALSDLDRLPQTRLVAHSSLYKSEPIDAGGPDYINAVAKTQTTLQPLELLQALQSLENAAGRQRPFQNAPRTLDLDLLLYDKLECQSEVLTLPHPRMHQRAFVLAPLSEISPGLSHPIYGDIDKLLSALTSQTIERLDT